ncbi:MAG: hypothetical protein IE927_01820 [Rhodobacterales bacterium]|nr:hypothetical protein [Rhodobacterales bacterium]
MGPTAAGLRRCWPRCAPRAARISDVQIVDGYIPEAARRLGLDWEADRISFTDVTVGAARLSGLLHGMGLDCTADDARPNGQDTLLLIVPHGEQHTLGAAILAGQLRRMGISVCFRLGPSLSDLAGLTAARHFKGALISIGSQDRINTCSMLVRTLHTLSKGTLRVVVGGVIVGSGSPDLLALGADAVTNEIEGALAVFGLDVHRHAAS